MQLNAELVRQFRIVFIPYSHAVTCRKNYFQLIGNFPKRITGTYEFIQPDYLFLLPVNRQFWIRQSYNINEAKMIIHQYFVFWIKVLEDRHKFSICSCAPFRMKWQVKVIYRRMLNDSSVQSTFK